MPAVLTYVLLGLGLAAVVVVLRICVLIGRAEDAANADRGGASIHVEHLVVNVNVHPRTLTGRATSPTRVLPSVGAAVGQSVRPALPGRVRREVGR